MKAAIVMLLVAFLYATVSRVLKKKNDKKAEKAKSGASESSAAPEGSDQKAEGKK